MLKYPFTPLLLAALLAGCSRSEPAAETAETPADAAAENIVTLTKENLAHLEIKTTPAALGSLAITLKAAGRVSENLNKSARISTTLEGRIAKLNYDLNDPVKAGDVLALIAAPELLGKPLELKAPIAGVIVKRASTVGELVAKGASLYTISDPADLWVVAEVKERDLATVQVGQSASFQVIAFPGQEFRGRVVRLANELESETRTLEARIETTNADRRLKPGMFAEVEITTTTLDGVLVIPTGALQSEGEEQVAFIALADRRFEKRVLQLGREQRGRVQVLAGLHAGEQVVTQGSFILKSEMLKGELGEE